ncbi:MAG: DUF3943 domain-containing protein [Planctomycetes bacterium]|nr:DUF3943 domain-containing protein [Planctomycetota bacterium]
MKLLILGTLAMIVPVGALCAGEHSDAPTVLLVPPAEPARLASSSTWPWTPAPLPEVPKWGEGEGRSYLIAALDIVGFELALNMFNREFNSEDVYRSSFSSISDNLSRGWIIDNDPFATNQFLHPIQGAMYHGFARSAGHGYWVSLAYDFAGSALWEVAGETGPPSLNDQITTSFGGSFLGEVMFRMSNYYLETGGEHPSWFRRFGAGVIAPSATFNRIAFGDRFDGILPSHDPAVYTRVGIGWRQNDKLGHADGASAGPREATVVDVVMDYGLPGKPTYEYTRPFDYFHFEASAASSTNSMPEDVMVRGLLAGTSYEWGNSYRGVWGLYGGYDYISPEVFSVSSTSLSLGTTGQWWFTDSLALQGTLLGGVGWTAAGTVADVQEERDYHYGVSPQTLGALRCIFGNVAVLDMTGRGYYLNAVGTNSSTDYETILRAKVALTLRVFGQHGLGIQYVTSSRDARYTDFVDTNQSIAAISLFYTYIGDTQFGAVDWR